MADQTLDQLPQEIVPDDGDQLYVVRNSADRRISRLVLTQGLVRDSRTITTQNGISGGGALSGDLTLSLDVAGLPEDVSPVAASDYVLTHDSSAGTVRKVRLDRLPGGTGGTPVQNTFSTIAVDGQTSLAADLAADTLTVTAGANIALSTNATTDTLTIAATGLVPTSRSLTVGAGLTGGGDLTASRSISLNIPGQSEDLAPVLANHYILTHETTSGALRKIRASLLGGGTYVLPAATGSVRGGVIVGSGLAVDVNGLLSATYTLPIASPDTLGGVRVGANLAVDGAGVLSASVPVASTTTLGGVLVGTALETNGSGVLSVRIGSGLTFDVDGRIATVPGNIPIATASVLGGIKVGSGLAIDGTGVLSATGQGGGGGGGTFATTPEAQAGTSTTTYMSPARTRDAITGYATANELSGTEGQVVGFDVSGAAAAVKNTRTMMVLCVAEATLLTATPNLRKLRMPIGLKLTSVEFYTPTAGTANSTFDINLNGTSIFSAPPTVTANTVASTTASFATATLPKGGIVDFDIDAAGAGARGLWVHLCGVEI